MALRLIFSVLFLTVTTLHAQDTLFILQPDRVFDGESVHTNWTVAIQGERIVAAGEGLTLDTTQAVVQRIDASGKTLMPGLIDAHTHVLLHPYNETSWNDQVLVESWAERTARATVHARKTLLAGFTTIRDLGTEGAGYTDVGIKEAIAKGVIPGPRMLVATRAIVATGSYGPKGFAEHVEVPLGAEPADGTNLVSVVRNQIGKGADLIKVYADYRWGLNGEAMPSFSEDELRLIVETAKSSGRPVVAHASTAEGIRRATMAGVATIEHGDGGTPEVFALMAKKGVALCPTLAAGDAIMQYRGWQKGSDPEPERIQQKRQSFQQALQAGVKLCAGGDTGVFTHGDNARELIMMADYGMENLDVLRAATSVNADVLGIAARVGRIRPGLLADMILVEGNPQESLQALYQVHWVMKGGKSYTTAY
uniref:Amidohydrolase family protein n=1 Tax=Roseihalotalea indica TaxID=2867963 RepID=A0AA49GHY0_9BACT|nr:amidohydrolase family protein [Tunicatimonas sp. TK19036]